MAVRRGFPVVAVGPSRLASWIRKDYPKYAPERGHSYLLALSGIDGPAG